MTLTAERIRELVKYNTLTGAFVRGAGGHGVKRGSIAGSPNGHGYLRISVDGRKYGAHQLAWLYVYGQWPERDIDHVNRDRADNRIANLRLADRRQNNANLAGWAGAGLKGAYRSGRFWRAQIQVDGRKRYLGTFPTAEAAHNAYCLAASTAFGEFACAKHRLEARLHSEPKP